MLNMNKTTDLVHSLRQVSVAYPSDIFTPLSAEEASAIQKAFPSASDRISAAMGRHLSKSLSDAANELERLSVVERRYETLRRLNAKQFADLYKKNIQTGTSFDELVDGLSESMGL